MSRRIVCWSLLGFLALSASTFAQGPQRPPATQPAAPTLEQRQPAAPPALSPEEEARLDQILTVWQQQSARVKTFESKFTRWLYDDVFGRQTTDQGEIRYAAPDKGAFQVLGDEPEHWVCDGRSIFEFDFVKKELIEHKLPPELQGKGITNSPLPFLFGSTAAELKKRYFLRLATPPNVQGQVWLEARPRFQADAQNFSRAEVILDAKTMLPTAIQTHEPNGKTRTVYQFESPQVDTPTPLKQLDPLNLFGRDPFKPTLPHGWKRVVEEVQG